MNEMSEFLSNIAGCSHPKEFPEKSFEKVLTINIKKDYPLQLLLFFTFGYFLGNWHRKRK